jgi:hypothetical protein
MSVLRTTSVNKSSQKAQVYQQLETNTHKSICCSVNRKTETDIFSVTLLLFPIQPKAMDSVLNNSQVDHNSYSAKSFQFESSYFLYPSLKHQLQSILQ